MDSPELIPVIFMAYYSGYHMRTVWRVHQARLLYEEVSLTRTWLSHWRDPEIAMCALRCSVRSIGVLVGIEIAEEKTPILEYSSKPKMKNLTEATTTDSKLDLQRETP